MLKRKAPLRPKAPLKAKPKAKKHLKSDGSVKRGYTKTGQKSKQSLTRKADALARADCHARGYCQAKDWVKYSPPRSTAGVCNGSLQWCHIESRRHKKIRWSPLNCLGGSLSMLKRKAPLRPKAPLKAKPKANLKRTPLKKSSAKNAKKDRAYRKVKVDKCHVCGKPAVHRHHIYAQSDKSWMATEPQNILPVCRECHDRAHEDMKGFRLMLRKTMRSRMEFLDGLAKHGGKDNQLRVWE